jgi:hypothetical protein
MSTIAAKHLVATLTSKDYLYVLAGPLAQRQHRHRSRVCMRLREGFANR